MVLIVCALAGELQGYDTLVTGVGKINAALTLTRFLAENPNPPAVINLGSAGGVGLPKGSLVRATNFNQWDMRCEGLDFRRGQTPFDNVPAQIDSTYDIQINGLVDAPCYTNDQFLDDPLLLPTGPSVVEMEAFALAKVCNAFSVPFGAVKYVTDCADEAASRDWQEALPGCAITLGDVADRLLNP